MIFDVWLTHGTDYEATTHAAPPMACPIPRSPAPHPCSVFRFSFVSKGATSARQHRHAAGVGGTRPQSEVVCNNFLTPGSRVPAWLEPAHRRHQCTSRSVMLSPMQIDLAISQGHLRALSSPLQMRHDIALHRPFLPSPLHILPTPANRATLRDMTPGSPGLLTLSVPWPRRGANARQVAAAEKDRHRHLSHGAL